VALAPHARATLPVSLLQALACWHRLLSRALPALACAAPSCAPPAAPPGLGVLPPGARARLPGAPSWCAGALRSSTPCFPGPPGTAPGQAPLLWRPGVPPPRELGARTRLPP